MTRYTHKGGGGTVLHDVKGSPVDRVWLGLSLAPTLSTLSPPHRGLRLQGWWILFQARFNVTFVGRDALSVARFILRQERDAYGCSACLSGWLLG